MLVASHRAGVVVAAIGVLACADGCSSRADPMEAPAGKYLAIGDSYSAGFRAALDGEPAGNTIP